MRSFQYSKPPQYRAGTARESIMFLVARKALALLPLLVPPVLAQTTWYVDVNGTAPGSGTQSDPYTSLQFAILAPATASGDTLLVAPGLYAESVDYAGKTLAIRSSGGAAVTTITPPIYERAVDVVTGEGPGTQLEGFTITGVHHSPYDGPTIRVIGSHLTLTACQVRDNKYHSPAQGGGLYGAQATLVIEGSRFARNAFDYGHGHGLYLENCETLMRDCEVAHHFGESDGSGLYAQGGTLVMESCRVASNSVIYAHGAGLNLDGTAARLTDCVIQDNQALEGNPGGGVFSSGGTLMLVGCRIAGNSADRGGGLFGQGILAFACVFEDNVATWHNGYGEGDGGAFFGSGTFERCLFVGNQALGDGELPYEGYGGAVHGGTLLNCTLVNNYAAGRGGAAVSAALDSCIVWGNTPDDIGDGPYGPPSSAVYSTIGGGYPGTGNLSGDPLFVDPASRDYHLRPDSPCIDSGNPALPHDPDSTRADMGAFAFDGTHPAVYCTAKVNSAGCTPAIRATGQATLSGADDFHVIADDVLGGQFGVLIWGRNPNDLPLFGGSLCVAQPFVRTPPTTSGGNRGGVDCSGRLDFFFSQAYIQAHALSHLDVIYAQWWYRDPGSASAVGLTAGLRFMLKP